MKTTKNAIISIITLLTIVALLIIMFIGGSYTYNSTHISKSYDGRMFSNEDNGTDAKAKIVLDCNLNNKILIKDGYSTRTELEGVITINDQNYKALLYESEEDDSFIGFLYLNDHPSIVGYISMDFEQINLSTINEPLLTIAAPLGSRSEYKDFFKLHSSPLDSNKN